MISSTTSRLTLIACLLTLAACSNAPGPAPAPAGAGTTAAEAQARRLPVDQVVQPQDLDSYLALPDAPLLLDVRSVKEFEAIRIPGTTLIPVQELPKRITELHAGRKQGVIIYCRSGRRARNAMGMLERAGFTDLALLDGSMNRWEKEGRPVEKGAPVE